ncbi:alpha/beta hydrolase [bacterium LRH843]|nr:alpha/beta hydrolase [bacterium LRH843]
MMDGMEQKTIKVNGVCLNVWAGGKGEPLLLIHGYPQTAIIWRKVAPRLMKRFTVVCPDLRGYGASDKPANGYDKRTMALDLKLLMEELGFQTYSVIGHDRGGRVAHRLTLDHPDSVKRLCLLDIVPTHTVFSRTTQELAAAYWHWFFFQPVDLPELLISANPEGFIRGMMNPLIYHKNGIEEEAMQEYIRAFKLPGTIRATLEDYRASAKIDFQHDEMDLGQSVHCPLLILWGKYGKMHDIFDVLDTWKEKGTSVTGRALSCGHFIPEEAPEELLKELQDFL